MLNCKRCLYAAMDMRLSSDVSEHHHLVNSVPFMEMKIMQVLELQRHNVINSPCAVIVTVAN